MCVLDLRSRVETNKLCVCANCEWVGRASRTNEICSAEQRLDPGSTVPVGECPNCFALVYIRKG